MTQAEKQIVLSVMLIVGSICGLVWLVTGGTGCASWQTTTTKAVRGIEGTAKATYAPRSSTASAPISPCIHSTLVSWRPSWRSNPATNRRLRLRWRR
jgi:hypothetical protein